jgi:hypothetical protein
MAFPAVENGAATDDHEEGDGRIHQRGDGTRYVKSEEFVDSSKGRSLLKRFSEHVEEQDSDPEND